MSIEAGRCGEFIQVLSESLGGELRKHGLSQARAAQVTSATAAAIGARFAGSALYFPKGRTCASDRQAQAQALRAEGLDVRQIAARMGVSRAWAYSLLAKSARKAAEIEERPSH